MCPGVNMYFYICVSLLVPVHIMCLFVYVCVFNIKPKY